MKRPRQVVSWTLAINIAVFICVGVIGAVIDWYFARFPRLEALTSTKNPLLQAIVVVGISAIPAIALVFLLTSTRCPLEFSLLGMKFKGTSGPILLWIATFVSVAAVILAFLAAS